MASPIPPIAHPGKSRVRLTAGPRSNLAGEGSARFRPARSSPLATSIVTVAGPANWKAILRSRQARMAAETEA